MDKKEKKHLIGTVLFLITLMISGVVLNYLYPPTLGQAASGPFALSRDCTTGTTTAVVIDESTLQYLTPGAGTTTITCNTANADELRLEVFLVASSTNTDLRWRVEFSNSTTTLGSGALWYPEPISLTQASNATTTNLAQFGREYRWLFASSTPHRYATSTTMSTTFNQDSTGSKTIVVSDINANLTRVEFYIPTGSIASVGILTTAFGSTPIATSTNAGVFIRSVRREPL